MSHGSLEFERPLASWITAIPDRCAPAGSFPANVGGSMIDKIVASPEAAVADIFDGATVMIGGFGTAGMPSELIDALIAQGARDLTIVNNNAGNGEIGLAALLKAKRVRKII